jgi:hypothetical protein
MHTVRLLLAISFVTLLAPIQANAFDQNRKGFLVGLGGGFGQSTMKLTASEGSESISAEVNNGGLAIDFRIGGGVSEKFWLYYTANSVIFDGGEFGDNTYVLGINGIGGTYFLQPQAPSAFFNGAIGAGRIFVADDTDSSESGPAIQLGFGYEFKEGLSAAL